MKLRVNKVYLNKINDQINIFAKVVEDGTTLFLGRYPEFALDEGTIFVFDEFGKSNYGSELVSEYRQKYWVNIYSTMTSTMSSARHVRQGMYNTREEADAVAEGDRSRIACIEFSKGDGIDDEVEHWET